ncbi:MAG: hypothetical protein KDD61_03910 [Bdellovibrionales bacterium]|nr:hypothetical protein [Bdellovibrionales bacterium]
MGSRCDVTAFNIKNLTFDLPFKSLIFDGSEKYFNDIRSSLVKFGFCVLDGQYLLNGSLEPDDSTIALVIASGVCSSQYKKTLETYEKRLDLRSFPVAFVIPEYMPLYEKKKCYEYGCDLLVDWPREMKKMRGLLIGLQFLTSFQKQARNSDDLMKNVAEIRLLTDRRLYHCHLQVSVYGDVLMLGGRVDSLWTKKIVESAASSIPGFNGILSEDLKVVPSSKRITESLSLNAKKIFEEYLPHGLKTVFFYEVDGSLRIDGTIPKYIDIQEIRSKVERLEGLEVLDFRVIANSFQWEQDEQLYNRICRLISESNIRSAGHVELAVCGGQVYVIGHWSSNSNKIRMEMLLRSVKSIKGYNLIDQSKDHSLDSTG